jgi:hypothetical protein
MAPAYPDRPHLVRANLGLGAGANQEQEVGFAPGPDRAVAV